MRSLLFFLQLLSLVTFLTMEETQAQNIYQWTDEQGVTHYSSSPENSQAKPASLPQIQRESIERNIQKLKAETPPSCEKHGGVDCPSGADNDGSVICRDGFREAKLPFRFECMEARLKTDFLLKVQGEALAIRHHHNLKEKIGEKKIREIYLSVRNISGVPATGVRAELRVAGRAPIQLHGPEAIDPYGQEDFMLPETNLIGLTLRDIEQARYRINCTNCSTSLGVN